MDLYKTSHTNLPVFMRIIQLQYHSEKFKRRKSGIPKEFRILEHMLLILIPWLCPSFVRNFETRYTISDKLKKYLCPHVKYIYIYIDDS